jgi:hypothetical protein
MIDSKKGSAGGKATALLLRSKTLDEYYSSPNICKECSEIIKVGDNEKVRTARKKKFCNSSCSASFNNRGKNRNSRRTRRKNEGNKKIDRIDISKLTKGELFSRYKTYQSARSTICKNARRVYFNSEKEKRCFECGYDRKIDIAHIKSVSSFSLDSRIEEINHIGNLIALCPNHHGEFDDGILDIGLNIF